MQIGTDTNKNIFIKLKPKERERNFVFKPLAKASLGPDST
jgi:hypothetical protein